MTLHAGFRVAGSLACDDALAAVPVPEGATRLLDIGRGRGLYPVAFASEYPALSAVVLDHPAVEPSFEATLADAPGVDDRVTFRSGDYRTDDLDEGERGLRRRPPVQRRPTTRRRTARSSDGSSACFVPVGSSPASTSSPATAGRPSPEPRFASSITHRLTLGAHTSPADR
ncbi:hypothetical protein BRC93_03485 [Halobacteriales archaeon QS_5_70_15]|nr:MAG: hypothetical protein BRC93_03485 [Halobacteriales archaeon QS_5_70_15]